MRWNESNPVFVVVAYIFAAGFLPWIVFSSGQVGFTGIFTYVYISALFDDSSFSKQNRKQLIAAIAGTIFSIAIVFYVYFNKTESPWWPVTGCIINFFFMVIMVPFLLPKGTLATSNKN